MEEDEDEQATSIKGRLLMLVNKIKGQSHKAEEPTEKEQAAPCEEVNVFFIILLKNICPAVMYLLNPLYLSPDDKLISD